MHIKKFVVLAMTCLYCCIKLSAQCGTDPAVSTTTISTANQILNSYFPGTGSPAQGSLSIIVGSIDARGNASSLAAGDLVLIIQMQGADINSANTDSYGDGVSGGSANGYLATNLYAGVYEYNTVASVAGSTITFSYSLTNNYYTQNFSGSNSIRKFQVIKVQRYYNLTINSGASVTAPSWNGSTGGIVVLDASNTLTNNGSVIATALGFRGGGGKQLSGATAGNTNGSTTIANTDYRWNTPLTTAANSVGAAKGEGIAGTPTYVLPQSATVIITNAVEGYVNGSFGRAAAANGGGGGNDGDVTQNAENAGGAGGGNGGAGGRGGNSWNSNLAIGGEPGGTFTQAGISRMVMGGGGGAGTANNSTAGGNEYQSSGGCGGGIILLRAKLFAGTGSIVADGGAAPGVVGVGGTGNTDAAGGGGAGGTIIAVTRTTGATGLGSITASAKGGKGGDMTNYYNHGPGGGGGGGVIISNGSFSTTNVTAGTNGLTRSTSAAGPIDNAYNSAAGANGVVTLLGGAPHLKNTNNGASPCGTLPVKLQSFYGVTQSGIVTLFWQIDKAINFDSFEIEYSTDGTSFKPATKVDYNSTKDLYSISLQQLNNPIIYYRLKMINTNGSYSYSDVFTIRNIPNAGITTLFPNPASSKTTLQFSANATGIAYLQIFDLIGKQVASSNTQLHNGINYIPVDCSTFSSGTYLIKLIDANGFVFAKEKLIVSKGK